MLFRSFILNNRIKSQAANFLAQLNQARAEAMRTGFQVTMCRGSVADGCVASNSTGSVWEGGWIAFIDEDDDEQLDDTGNLEEVINISGAELTGTNTLRSAAFTTFIAFNPDGSTSGPSASPASGGFALCDSRGESKGRAILVSATGRARVTELQGSGLTNCNG